MFECFSAEVTLEGPVPSMRVEMVDQDLLEGERAIANQTLERFFLEMERLHVSLLVKLRAECFATAVNRTAKSLRVVCYRSCHLLMEKQ